MAGPANRQSPAPRSPSQVSRRTFKRILLVKPSSLGDIVHALPVLHGLRTRYPEARIDWLVSSAFAELLKSHDELDELILFDRRRFARIGRSRRPTQEFIRFVRALRARRYDLAIDLQGLFRTGFLTWTSGAPVRIGFRGAREAAWMFYTHRIRIDDPDTHAVDRNYRVAELLGFDDVPVTFNLSLTRSDRVEARELLRTVGLTGEKRVLAVVPGARWETKVWPAERFAEVIDQVHKRGGVRAVLLGSPDEVSLCERIAAACESAPVNLAGRTSLRQLAAVLGLTDLVLCHDSAAMHLAVALKRPLVCLIGPTNPRRTGPYRRIDDVVRLKLDCAPCYLRRLSQCRFDHRCMNELDADTVVGAVEKAFARPAQEFQAAMV